PKEYFRNILTKGDGSILEHATVTFALVWISRVATHEIVRHRVGTAYSQESLRYVRVQEIRVPNWKASVDARNMSEEIEKKMIVVLKELESEYKAIVDKVDWDKLSFDAKKSITSAIRRILPQGLSTVIIFTANHRTLRWLIEMRTSPGAEYEIRSIFDQIGDICIKDYPLIYNDFERNKLPDGTYEYKPTLRSKV
ncbi:MAG TPA: FAD-dependent thymidylate synthase, partial [Candidatus Binatus sp.]|nr:FAD-dependent thymidylate synthase [Candidatus Binatus sp.]